MNRYTYSSSGNRPNIQGTDRPTGRQKIKLLGLARETNSFSLNVIKYDYICVTSQNMATWFIMGKM